MPRQTEQKRAFMQTLRMNVDLPFLKSLDKHNQKKTFMQTRGMCVDLHFQISLEKRN